MPITLRSALRTHGSRLALIHRGGEFTGETLDAWAGALADALTKHGAGPRHRIGILMGNTPEFIVSMLAAMKLDASSVLLGTQFRSAEIDDAIRRTQTTFVLESADSAPISQPWAVERVGTYTGPRAISMWRTAYNTGAAAPGEAIVQFTSGVSGRSKIVTRHGTNLQDELENFAAHLGLASSDVTVCPAPLFHAYGLINGFLLPFYSGRPTVLVDWFLPNDVVDIVKRYQARVLVAVPALYKAMAEAYGATSADLQSLRICFSAGAPLSRDVFDAYSTRFGRPIHQQYGSTETGVITVNLLDTEPLDVLAAGRPVRGRTIKIVEESGAAAAAAMPGEIAVRSQALAPGYLGDSALTAEKFRDGWYFTGDLGWIDERGSLQLTGRKTSFINVAGMKVDPAEVERVLASLDTVAECAVVPRFDPSAGQVVSAFVVPRRRTSEMEVQRFCRQWLPPHKVPRRVTFVEALPRTATGKIMTKYLLEQ